MRDADLKTPIDFIHEVVRRVLWEVSYNESRIARAHRTLNAAKDIMKRENIDYNQIEQPEGDHDAGPLIATVEQLICHHFEEAEESAEYYERNLKIAHNHMAFMMIMLARGNYTEIDVPAIQKEVDEQLKK